jgi:glycosyltransferase involved in cell wall biosynthesis
MKILLCNPALPSKELGAPKVLIELAEELEKLSWTVRIINPTDISTDIASYTGVPYQHCYAESLRKYLHQHAADYNVIDYNHVHLPYPRSEFSQETLFVARSALLAHHLETFPIPSSTSLKAKVSNLLKGASRQAKLQSFIRDATLTIQEADLVNVNNDDSKTELVKRGISSEKISVIPLGISRTRRSLFDAVPSVPPQQPIVSFIGTFDWRKGATDFPIIMRHILAAIPDVRFRLLGTKGMPMFQTEQQVLAYFPVGLRDKIEVIPRFPSEELPTLLAPCSIGIFPSYLEGFGLGILEMLSASIPVIAYDVPGPRMMLPSEYLVPRGDIKGMSNKVINLLQSTEKLKSARLWAKQQSQKFCWQQIAQITSDTYLHFLELKHFFNKKK